MTVSLWSLAAYALQLAALSLQGREDTAGFR